MPRTVPGAISGKIGQANLFFVWLVEWQLPGIARYYSSGLQVTYNGNVYERNRVEEISGLTAQYIDRKTREFGRITITLDNLADDGSSNFPFTALDAAQVFEDAIIKIHLYDVDAGVAVDSLWWGYSGRPTFNPEEKTVDLTASFLWDAREIVVPSRTLQQEGFGTLENERNKQEFGEETAIPLAYGVGNIKVRPAIYAARVEGSEFHINFVITGCASGFPMAAGDLTSAAIKLFNVTPASDVEFLTGTAGQGVPANKSRFPDGLAHPLIAYGWAAFPITDQTKDRLDQIGPDEIKMTLVNGRPLLDTGVPSENPVLILKDILRDPNFGIGLENSKFDAGAVTAAANYASTHWQARVELSAQTSLTEFIQQMLGDIHGYLTFNNGLIQIGVKHNAEASIATFATIDSGVGGRRIHNDEVRVSEKDSSELINQANIEYRKKNRHPREVIVYDPVAQARPGSNTKKPVKEDIEMAGLYDETQVGISGAILLREEQNADLFIEFAAPLVEGLDVAPGDLIEVRSPDIFNNGSNRLFRIHAQTFETGEEPLVQFTCQIYKSAVYDYSTAGIGVDLLRGSDDTSSQGRPPDVIPSSLAVVDIATSDGEGRLATIRATWTYPTVDLTGEQADNTFREYPISAVQIWWRYTDESIHQARQGNEVKHPTAQAEFQLDWHKNRSIEVYFVALGHNRSRSPLGYLPDQTKTAVLTAALSATAITASVDGTADFNVNDLVFIEFEIDKVQSKTANTLTFVNSGGVRTAQLNTAAIAHPNGTQVSVAKQSYPSLTMPLTAPRFTYAVVQNVLGKQRHDGVRFHWDDVNATNAEKYHLYWSTDTDANTNPAKLGSATPAWYTSDPRNPPASVKLKVIDDVSIKILQEEIGAAGTTVYARVAARNGKHNFSSALSGLASNKLGDDGVPVLSTGPTLIWKQNGLRARCPLPSTNMKTFSTAGKVELVLFAANSGGATIGFISDATGAYTASGVEFRFNLGLESSQTFNLKRAELLSLFPAIASLRGYFYVTNAVGTSSASPLAILPFSGLESDPVASDSAAPGNLPQPVLRHAKAAKLVCNFDSSVITGKNTWLRTEWLIGNASTLPACTKFLNIGTVSDNGAVQYWEDIGQGTRATVHVTLQRLKDIFGTSATLFSYYRVTNAVNTTTSVASAGLALSSQSDMINDQGLDPSAKIPSRLLSFTTTNLIDGGAFLNTVDQFKQNGNTDAVGKDFFTKPDQASRIVASAFTHGSKWEQANHRLLCDTNIATVLGKPCYRLRRQIIPGETYGMGVLAAAASGFTLSSFTIRLWDSGQSAGLETIDSVAYTNLVFTTSYRQLVALFQAPSSYQMSTSGEQLLVFDFTVNPSFQLFFDNLILLRNQQVLFWFPGPVESQLNSFLTITSDTGAGGVGAGTGAGNVGDDGAGFQIGGVEGGFLIV